MTNRCRWVTVEEFAPMMNMSTGQVYKLIREDKFPFRIVRMGRLIRIDAIDAGLYSHEEYSDRELQIEALPKSA
jgi:excisionase family DNA binding protein